jgi:hypothetical protein
MARQTGRIGFYICAGRKISSSDGATTKGTMLADSYTQLWSKDRFSLLQKHGKVGTRLTVLFGGPHLSEPGFRRFGVREGDSLYPMRVSAGILYILGRMKVRRLLSIDAYIAENRDTFGGYEADLGGEVTFANWQRAHPEELYLAPTCTDEVALGEEGTPVGLDIPVPREVLEGLRFCSQKGERGIKHVVDGCLSSVISLQGGTYRLSDGSARAFDALLKNTPAASTCENCNVP